MVRPVALCTADFSITNVYNKGMSHFILKRGKYWEEYENMPGERGKKRFVRYWGRIAPPGTPQRMAQMLDTAQRLAEKIDAEQREMFGETASERREREEEEAKFCPARFLEQTEEGPAVAEPIEPTLASEEGPHQPSSDAPASSETSALPHQDE